MLDMDNGYVAAFCLFNCLKDILQSLIRIPQWECSAGKVIILQVDN